MKKTLLFASTVVGAALSLTGCTSVHVNEAAIPTAPVIDQKHFTADIVLQSGNVSGTATVHSLFGFINWGVSSFADDAFVSTTSLPVVFAGVDTVAKQGAAFNACANAKADYILGAKYRIDTADYIVYKQVKCTVTGTPANYNGVK